MSVRKRLVGPVVLVMGATGHALSPGPALAEEPPILLALRPSFDPSEADAAPRRESGGLFVTTSAEAKRTERSTPEPLRPLIGLPTEDPTPDAPVWAGVAQWSAPPLNPALFENPNVALALPEPVVDDFDARWRRAAAGGGMDYQYILAATHFPAWVGASATMDALRRQDNLNWRQKWALTPRSGWEAEFAPASGVLLGARSYFSPGMERTLLEAKLGVAVLDGLPFPFQANPALYIGPFLTADGLHFDGGTKAGAHVTFGQIGLFHLTFAAGLARDRWGAPGTFALFQSSVRF